MNNLPKGDKCVCKGCPEHFKCRACLGNCAGCPKAGLLCDKTAQVEAL
jgi:hypothetical protein